VGVLGRREGVGARHAAGLGPDHGEQGALHGALVDLDVASDLEPPEQVEELLEGDALRVEPQEAVAGEHAQVAEHLALVGEERGVAARAGRERDHVVGDLPLQEVARLAPGEDELAALGAVDHARALAQRPVVGRGIGDGHHCPSS
jgi:hypothetical protein